MSAPSIQAKGNEEASPIDNDELQLVKITIRDAAVAETRSGA